MRKIFCLLLFSVSTFVTVSAQVKSIAEMRRIFDYDQSQPLDVKEVKVINRSGVSIRDITYASPKFGRVTAYLVEPAQRI